MSRSAMSGTDTSASDVYGRHWASDYDALYAERDDTALVAGFLAPFIGSRGLVEFGIGTGRIALPLAQLGHHVAGIDASPAMLEVLTKKAGAEAIAVTIGSITSASAGALFDVVLLNFSTLFLLTSQSDQIACFKNAASHLTSGGRFIVEAFVPDHSRWVRGQTVQVASLSETEVDLQLAVHDRAAQTILAQHMLARDEKVSLRPTRYRYAWPSELDLMAVIAGLTLEMRHANWRKDIFTSECGSHVSVYRKG